MPWENNCLRNCTLGKGRAGNVSFCLPSGCTDRSHPSLSSFSKPPTNSFFFFSPPPLCSGRMEGSAQEPEVEQWVGQRSSEDTDGGDYDVAFDRRGI